MPELPEVEVIKRGLALHLPGRRVMGIVAGRKKLRQPVPRKCLKELILEQRVRSVDRRAKFLLILMESDATLVIHLGMSGRLGLFPVGSPVAKHDHLRLQLDNNMELRFNDPRRFGSVRVALPAEDLSETFFSGVGPEPLWKDFNPACLRKLAAGKTRPLKNFLMDSRVVAGIGNIYACEILFHARLNPLKKVDTLTLDQWKKVVAGSRYILEKAIEKGGTTVSDFVNESGRSGYFQLELQVYGREGKPCRKCSKPVIRKVMAGRSTFFCSACQK